MLSGMDCTIENLHTCTPHNSTFNPRGHATILLYDLVSSVDRSNSSCTCSTTRFSTGKNARTNVFSFVNSLAIFFLEDKELQQEDKQCRAKGVI